MVELHVVQLFFLLEGICALPYGRPSINSIIRSVREGGTIMLSCNAQQSSSDTDPITWSWMCGNEDMTINGTAKGRFSELSFTADRRHDTQHCRCKAEAINSLNETYTGYSENVKIDVYYEPSSSPKLNVSEVMLYPGEEATLGCLIDSLGNPSITWSWICGTQTMNRRKQTKGLATDLVITAEPELNGKSCYCTASVQYQPYQSSSNTAAVTVYYNPSDYPTISRTTTSVSAGSVVEFQCSLSSTGNPPITWSWYCNDAIVTKGVRHRDRTTHLSFVAHLEDDGKVCYCRAQGSFNISGTLYDKKSSFNFISVSALYGNAPNIQFVTSSTVKEGDAVTLSCNYPSSTPRNVTLVWICGKNDMTTNSTAVGRSSILSFTANRRHNKQLCYCKALSRDTYDKSSGYIHIGVAYKPLIPPILNVSVVMLYQGDQTTLKCSIDSLGNPQITWSWTCGTRRMHSRVQTDGTMTTLVITSEPDLNEKFCYCSAQGNEGFQLNSNTAFVRVIYNPPDNPRISPTAINVKDGSLVKLQCSLSVPGNPMVIWSWHCDESIVNKGVLHRDKTTELSFVAGVKDGRKECYCRARGSRPISGILYDRNSSMSVVVISDNVTLSDEQFDKGDISLSPVATWVILAILLLTLVLCAVIMFIQQRRIPKESSLLSCFQIKQEKEPNTHCQPSETNVAFEENSYEQLESVTLNRIGASNPSSQSKPRNRTK